MRPPCVHAVPCTVPCMLGRTGEETKMEKIDHSPSVWDLSSESGWSSRRPPQGWPLGKSGSGGTRGHVIASGQSCPRAPSLGAVAPCGGPLRWPVVGIAASRLPPVSSDSSVCGEHGAAVDRRGAELYPQLPGTREHATLGKADSELGRRPLPQSRSCC